MDKIIILNKIWKISRRKKFLILKGITENPTSSERDSASFIV